MRVHFWVVAIMLACGALPASAGINVSSYDTLASANGYAPLDRSEYFDTDDNPNTSPAAPSLADNWSGTDVGGSTATWNMVASATISTSTTFSPNNLATAGSGSFSYSITTTTDFMDPTSVTTLYVPGAGVAYRLVFTTDTPASYSCVAQLKRYSEIELASFTTGSIFDDENPISSAKMVDENGTILPGQYQLTVEAGLAGPSPLPNGVNQISENGGVSSFSFILQVPEPAVLGYLFSYMIFVTRRPLDPRHP